MQPSLDSAFEAPNSLNLFVLSSLPEKLSSPRSHAEVHRHPARHVLVLPVLCTRHADLWESQKPDRSLSVVGLDVLSEGSRGRRAHISDANSICAEPARYNYKCANARKLSAKSKGYDNSLPKWGQYIAEMGKRMPCRSSCYRHDVMPIANLQYRCEDLGDRCQVVHSLTD